MTSKIILKKSSVAAKAPVAGDLVFGELAINYTDSKLYFKKADGSIDAFTTAAASAPVTSVGGNIGAITDAQLLASIKNVDGAGSGLDADFLDGLNASAFYLASNPNGYTNNTGTVTSVGATAPLVSSGGNNPSLSIPAANSTTNGFMSSAYAGKLDGIAAGATNVTNTNQLTNGAGYITSAALSSYLPLTGGNLTTGASSNLFIGRNSTATNYNAISLNGNPADSSNMGLTGGGVGDTTLYINSPGSINVRTSSFGNSFFFSGSSFTAPGDIRAPIFYDSNDTGYYIDPSSYSRIRQLTLTQARVDSSKYPVGHYAPGEEVFAIDPTWTQDQIREYFNSNNVSWVADSTAPGGYAIQLTGAINVGGVYGSGFPYIPVETDDTFYMEVYIKNVTGSNTHYMGSMDFNHNFSNLGGNPGSFGYWVMSNSNPGTGWTKYSGYISGFGTAIGQFVSGTEYWTPQALFNYSGGGTSYISGWKVVKLTKGIVGRFPNSTTNTGEAWYGRANDRNRGTYTIQLGGGSSSGRQFEVVDYAWSSVMFKVSSDNFSESAGSSRAPLFYDSNNTGYYLDPNSTSNLYDLQLTGGKNTYLYINPGNGYEAMVRYNGGSGSGWYVGKRMASVLVGTESFHFYSEAAGATVGGVDTGGNMFASGSHRAPIFYDSNDTGYYIDPNSTSNTALRMRGGALFGPNPTWGEYLYVGSNGNVDVNTATVAVTNGNLHLDAKNGYVMYLNNYATSSYTIVNQSIRSPIFYDNDNTGYYTDPNSSSRLGTVNADTLRSYNNIYLDNQYGSSVIGVYASTRYQGVFSMGDAYKLPLDGTTTGNLYGLAWSHPNAGGTAGNLNTHGLLVLENGGFLAAVSGSIRSRDDMRSPIFYDSNNTGYYVDPNSVSYLYGLTLAGGSYFRPQNWLQFDGSYGLYWPNHYGAHLHANDLSTYTQLALRGSKNSYGGIYDQFSAVNIGMYDSGGNGGVYREANGRWFSYYNVGNDCWGFGTSSTSSAYNLYAPKGIYSGGRVDGTIFYDSNNTGYYADLNSTTYLYYLQSATTVRADSDRRLKENITPIKSALSLVRQLQGCRYTRNDLADKTKVYIGMIAQDVLPIVPEVVSGSEAGKYSLGYAELVPVLNEAVKELDEIVSKQAAVIAKLEERLSKLLGE